MLTLSRPLGRMSASLRPSTAHVSATTHATGTFPWTFLPHRSRKVDNQSAPNKAISMLQVQDPDARRTTSLLVVKLPQYLLHCAITVFVEGAIERIAHPQLEQLVAISAELIECANLELRAAWADASRGESNQTEGRGENVFE